MQRHIELRKLPEGSLWNIENILEINNDWQSVVLLIPKDLRSAHFERKYNSEHMRTIKEHAKNTNKTCAKVLFDEWGTSGRVRPTVEALMKILQQAQIFRAVDEIARMLGEPRPPRPKNIGPGDDVSINLTELLDGKSVEERLNSMPPVQSDDLRNSSHDQSVFNSTEKQTSTPSFPETVPSNNSSYIPDFNALQTFDNQSAVQMEHSDLIPISKSAVIASGPDFSALLQINETEGESSQVDMTSQRELDQYTPDGNVLSVQNISSIIDNDILEDKNLVHFEYRELESITNKFSDTFIDNPVGPVGKIASGGFGDVYVGIHSTHGALAVKRVKIHEHISRKIAIKVFNTEVKSLSHLRHENIVPIFGYSIDGPTPCIVCDYIDGGSLQEKIAAKVLTEVQRINIMRGTAVGLQYIHHSERPPQPEDPESQTEPSSTKKSYYLHGDVKSANILLTKDCVPKLCDFGLAKHLDTTFIITKSIMGTSAYMAPESFSGTVTQKNDIFSFGIVLLELLTGCKPIITTYGENRNIKNYVEGNCLNGDITNLLDKVVNKWTKALDVYNLAQRCLDEQINKRPCIDEICEILIGICQKP